MMGFIVDQTELSQALRKANDTAAACEQFIRNMNHELRTPMNALIGFSQLLNHSDSEETVGKLRDSIRSLMRQIEEALDFSARPRR